MFLFTSPGASDGAGGGGGAGKHPPHFVRFRVAVPVVISRNPRVRSPISRQSKVPEPEVSLPRVWNLSGANITKHTLETRRLHSGAQSSAGSSRPAARHGSPPSLSRSTARASASSVSGRADRRSNEARATGVRSPGPHVCFIPVVSDA